MLSPADCSGKRAHLLRNPAARFDLAARLQGAGGAPLGEVFAFMSGLYFRGKLAYARAFAAARRGVMVITPSDGLCPPEQATTLADLDRYAAVPIAADEARYSAPLLRDARDLAARVAPDGEIVFLGSVATNKYLQILAAALGERVRVPREFIGLGDMSRGALLLRCVRENRELDYVGLRELPARRR